MQQFFDTLAGAGSHLDETVVAALLGSLIAAIVTWAGLLVTRSGAKASNRTVRAEKRATLVVRELSPSSGGAAVKGVVANLGATAAVGVEIRCDAEAEAFGAIGAGERLAFELAVAAVDGAALGVSYRDFLGRPHREAYRLRQRHGRLVMTRADD